MIHRRLHSPQTTNQKCCGGVLHWIDSSSLFVCQCLWYMMAKGYPNVQSTKHSWIPMAPPLSLVAYIWNLHLHKHKILPYKHTEQVVTTMMVYSILSRFQCQLVFFCISLLVKWRSIVMCFVWWIQLPSYCGGALISTILFYIHWQDLEHLTKNFFWWHIIDIWVACS